MNKRREVWAKKHGPIPKGYLVWTLNGQPADCRAENLAAIPRNAEPRVLIAPFAVRIRELERLLNEVKGESNVN